MDSRKNRNYIRAKLAAVQVRCEQVDAELEKQTISRAMVRMLIKAAQKELESLYVHCFLDNNKKPGMKPGPDKDVTGLTVRPPPEG